MKRKTLLKKTLALVCAGILSLSFLASCVKNNDEGETEKPTIEVAPEVELSGESPLAMLDRGENPAVRIGPFEISADFIRTYLKKSIIETGEQITALAAAYEIAAIYYAERAIAGTEEEATIEMVQESLDKNEEYFEEDREENLAYCEMIGLTPEEFVDFINIGEMKAYVSLRHYNSIYEYIEQSYENRLAADGSDENFSEADLSEYYPEYMKVIVRRLDKEDLIAGAVDEVNVEIDDWVKEYYVTS